MPEHEIITYIAPFMSGAFGAGIVWGYVRTKIREFEKNQTRMELKLDQQVGDGRCTRMRQECRADVLGGIERVEKQILANRDYVTDRFVEIARFMGQHNGH